MSGRSFGARIRARRDWMIALGAVALASAAIAACGGGHEEGPKMPTKSGSAANANANAEDQSRCDFKGRTDREVIESTGPGALVPNVRRVFAIVGEGDDRRRVLLCREIDTNLDGMKDVVRTYDEKGDSLREQADSDYDGRIDTWITFARGRMAKVEVDRNSDGKPDEFKYYVRGDLSRVQRDTNYDGKADVWEIYNQGVLERMGVDLDHDGHVDRWDRDEVARLAAEKAEREEEEKAEAERKAKEAEATDAGVTDARVSARKRN
ncbi:MAG: hypothetical protein KC766_10465 [Myxococcales bacterium]|nr:hypothetical protein [Myxococcales bacterium]